MIDASELATVTVALDKATLSIGKDVTAVVKKGGMNVAQDARRRVSGLRHAPAYPLSIDSEVIFERGAIAAEIGPDKDRPQGALGNILQYGTMNNPPHAHLGPALDLEAPKFTAFLIGLAAPW